MAVDVRISPLPPPQRLTLPGGASIEHLQLVDIVQPALAPLMPIFDILEAVLAVFDTVKAVPEAFGPPPDPSALIEALQKLAVKVASLLRLVPQLSLPFTIIGLLDLLLHTLEQARDQLEHLKQRAEAVHVLEQRSRELDDPQLHAIAALARANLEQEAANVGARLGALSRLIVVLNVFTSMVGAPKVSDFSSLPGQPLDALVESLDAIVDALRVVRRAVPLP